MQFPSYESLRIVSSLVCIALLLANTYLSLLIDVNCLRDVLFAYPVCVDDDSVSQPNDCFLVLFAVSRTGDHGVVEGLSSDVCREVPEA